MIILGIDPGIAIVGYGIIEYKNSKFRVIDYGAVTTPAGMDILQRLELVYKGIDMLIKNYNIDEVGIEELFFNKNVKTAITVAQARGVTMLACAHNNKPVYEYTPLQVKPRCSWIWKSAKSSSTTDGYLVFKSKTKYQSQMMLQMLWQLQFVTRMLIN